MLRSRLPRLGALVLLLLLVLGLPGSALSQLAAPAENGPRLFASSSVWNAPLARRAQLDPRSGALVAGLVSEVAKEVRLGWGPWISTATSSPIYRVGAGQRTVKVQLDDPTRSWRAPLQAALDAVPIPAAAKPAEGTDAHLTVWQPSTDKLWELWKARKLADGWHASWGGAIAHVSKSPGYYTVGSWPGSRTFWGATATSLPVAAGMITVRDLRRGRIDHALAVDLPYPKAGVYSWPAQRSDGNGIDPNAIPEGAHLRLDPDLDLGKLTMLPLVRMMAVAAQRYGMIVRDQTHHAISFFVENLDPSGSRSLFYGPDGLPSPSGFFAGQYPGPLLATFPWASLRVLKMRLHRTAS